MLTAFTLSLLYFVWGVLIGIYLPLAGLYFLHFVRKRPFGFRLVWKASLRVVLVLFGLCSLFFALGALIELSGGFSEYSLKYSAWLGWGAIFAFFAGTILFFAGVWKAWRARAAQR
jgi:hypothetical protein